MILHPPALYASLWADTPKLKKDSHSTSIIKVWKTQGEEHSPLKAPGGAPLIANMCAIVNS